MDFQDIRPYQDSEYQTVIQKLLARKAFFEAAKSYLTEFSEDQIRQVLLSCNTIKCFQQNIISPAIDKIIALSLTDLTCSGIKSLDAHQQYLFISNHRDIVLDSAFLNYSLNKEGYDTCEIAIGSNLLGIDWVRDLVRINKSFIVKRGLSKQEMLEASKTLSGYIDHTLHRKKESVWIAQREGRAKDGNDRTNPGLLKMLCLGSDKSLLQHLIDLNILPVSIAYEYDPCDYLKIPELMARAAGQSYTKSPNEDVHHMICGIQGFKGRVNLTFGAPVNPELKLLEGIKNRNEQLRMIAQVIDRQILKNYHLWPTNYAAYDELHGTDRFSFAYTDREKASFTGYMAERLKGFEDRQSARRLFLEMYANPVTNRLAAEET